ncbi:unannotated protein [freshwater metagenome]|uniref:Unannotated protein n=1 Tax=freshwater metagenome TaxID=449393 RepID=A0A6J7HVK2_9ZZZZ
MRRQVIAFLPPPVSPMRSMSKEAPAWPAIDATEKIATPKIGTALVWTATKVAPSAPANSLQIGMRRCFTASRILDAPSFIPGIKSEMRKIAINPEPKENNAASKPLFNRCDNSPFTRDCTAIRTPANAARKSSLIYASY